jgi:excisionase family DNA binding protein
MNIEDAAIINEMVPMLTVRDVARLFDVHTNTVRRWSNCGRIRTYHISKRGDRRFRRDDVFRLLRQLKAHRGNQREVNISRRKGKVSVS